MGIVVWCWASLSLPRAEYEANSAFKREMGTEQQKLTVTTTIAQSIIQLNNGGDTKTPGGTIDRFTHCCRLMGKNKCLHIYLYSNAGNLRFVALTNRWDAVKSNRLTSQLVLYHTQHKSPGASPSLGGLLLRNVHDLALIRRPAQASKPAPSHNLAVHTGGRNLVH